MKIPTYLHRAPIGHSQSGAALAISLIMLLLLTLLGITATQTTTMQERMSGNAKERNNAFQVTEAGLRDAEKYLDKTTNPAFVDIGSSSSDGLYFENTAATDAWYLGKTSATATSTTATIDDSNYGYVIEELSAVSRDSWETSLPGTTRFYRITARGTGPSGTSVVLLQSTYKR